MKRMILLIMVLVLTVVFTGCNRGRDGGGGGGRQTIKLASFIQANPTIHPITGIRTVGAAEIERLMSELTGHNIEIVNVGGGTWIQQLETLVSSGEVDLGIFTNQVMVPRWFEELTPWIERSEVLGNGGLERMWNDYVLYYTRYHTFDIPEAHNQIYGLPFYRMVDSRVAYDALIFEQWGVEPPKDGDSFWDILETARRVHGINPVTGVQNYGLHLVADRTEFMAISFDAWPAIRTGDMDIRNFDTDRFVEPLRTSPELLEYYEWLAQVVEICPPGITTGAGAERWMTMDNNIAINLHPTRFTGVFPFLRAGMTDFTDRFRSIFYPVNSEGQMGFPEFEFMGMSQFSSNKEIAWDVLLTFTTNKTALDLLYQEYFFGNLPTLRDTSGLAYMDRVPGINERMVWLQGAGYRTDDYWWFRTPIAPVIAEMLAQMITPEVARQRTYEEISRWVDNRIRLAQ